MLVASETSKDIRSDTADTFQHTELEKWKKFPKVLCLVFKQSVLRSYNLPTPLFH